MPAGIEIFCKSMTNNYLNDLNEPQREAVINYSGPSLIIAGAGAGKTRVLTYRIAHLLNKGVRANQILALTFTNKAAREMKERITGIAGADIARFLWMGTFHSVFAKILRIFSRPCRQYYNHQTFLLRHLLLYLFPLLF